MALIILGLYFMLLAFILYITPSGVIRIAISLVDFSQYRLTGVAVFFLLGVLLIKFGFKYEANKEEKKIKKKNLKNNEED